jgi:hypothetical protein
MFFRGCHLWLPCCRRLFFGKLRRRRGSTGDDVRYCPGSALAHDDIVKC